jgi:hypothetical protein
MLFDAVTPPSATRITSRHNPCVAQYRAAARGDATGRLLLDGPHLVADALAAGLPIEHAAVVSSALDRDDIRPLMAELERTGVETVVTTAQVMAAMSPVRSSSAIVALAHRPVADATRLYAGTAPLVLIASDVQDPGNLGAIVRAAEAGSATSVIAAGACADPFDGDRRAALDCRLAPLPTRRLRSPRRAATAVASPRPHRAADARCMRSTWGAAAVLVGGVDQDSIPQPSTGRRVDHHPDAIAGRIAERAVAAAIVVCEALRQSEGKRRWTLRPDAPGSSDGWKPT